MFFESSQHKKIEGMFGPAHVGDARWCMFHRWLERPLFAFGIEVNDAFARGNTLARIRCAHGDPFFQNSHLLVGQAFFWGHL